MANLTVKNLLEDVYALLKARRKSRTDAEDTMAGALRADIARMKRLSLFDLAGRIDFDPSYDYKAARSAR